MQDDQPALIVLHSKHDLESVLNGKVVRLCASKCIKMQQLKNAVRQVKGQADQEQADGV